MSMMMPPGSAPPNLPVMPGGGDTAPPPMDSLAGQSLPTGGGMDGLMAALQGGDTGGDLGPDQGGPSEDTSGMDPVEHIQQAMKHLMMALAKEQDEERGSGIVKGMGALQGILGGEQKKNAQLQSLGG